MDFLADAMTTSPAIGVHLSIALSRTNEIWKFLFFKEFSDVAKDLKILPTTEGIPFDWNYLQSNIFFKKNKRKIKEKIFSISKQTLRSVMSL